MKIYRVARLLLSIKILGCARVLFKSTDKYQVSLRKKLMMVKQDVSKLA